MAQILEPGTFQRLSHQEGDSCLDSASPSLCREFFLFRLLDFLKSSDPAVAAVTHGVLQEDHEEM